MIRFWKGSGFEISVFLSFFVDVPIHEEVPAQHLRSLQKQFMTHDRAKRTFWVRQPLFWCTHAVHTHIGADFFKLHPL